MSIFVNSVKKLHLCNYRLSISRLIHSTQAVNLYSPSALGIDGYQQARKRVKEKFTNFADTFRNKMNDFVLESKHMIFTEDLKNMAFIAEVNDLNLVLDMIKKFNNQNSKYRFDSFVFGPVVMRMFYFLNAPKEALQCFEDPTNDGFFDQLISSQILLDLLYNHEMYDEMYRVFEMVQQKQLNMTKFPKYQVNLVLAACYKQNTEKSMEYASKLWSEMTCAGIMPMRRASTLFADRLEALALKQGAPDLALESITMQKQHYITIRNIKAMALADLGRADDALPVLRMVLDIDIPEQQGKHTFFEETIVKVQGAIEKTENKDIQNEFYNIEKALRDRNLVDNQTLDQVVTSEIKKSSSAPRRQSGMPQLPYAMRQSKNLNVKKMS